MSNRPDLYGWSSFDTERNVDFNSCAWIRPNGNVLIDPLPLSNHDFAHLNSLGGAAWIFVTNSDHVRAAKSVAHVTGAKIAAPSGERKSFPIACVRERAKRALCASACAPRNRWLEEGDELIPGLQVFEMQGSKSPGELALLLEQTTLITGDLVRAHRAGSLMILPDEKLKNRAEAVASVRRLSEISGIETVLVGDGWSIFRDGSSSLKELAATL